MNIGSWKRSLNFNHALRDSIKVFVVPAFNCLIDIIRNKHKIIV